MVKINRCGFCGKRIVKGKTACKDCINKINTIEKNKRWLELNKRFLGEAFEDKASILKGAILCKICKVRTKVVDCRMIKGIFIRRRECIKCKKRFNTYEVLKK